MLCNIFKCCQFLIKLKKTAFDEKKEMIIIKNIEKNEKHTIIC